MNMKVCDRIQLLNFVNKRKNSSNIWAAIGTQHDNVTKSTRLLKSFLSSHLHSPSKDIIF